MKNKSSLRWPFFKCTAQLNFCGKLQYKFFNFLISGAVFFRNNRELFFVTVPARLLAEQTGQSFYLLFPSLLAVLEHILLSKLAESGKYLNRLYVSLATLARIWLDHYKKNDEKLQD